MPKIFSRWPRKWPEGVRLPIRYIMFIAHAPSGYLMSVWLTRRIRGSLVSSSALIVACVFGAVAPDMDLAYFYLIDHRQTHHHKYISHWPSLWGFLLMISYLYWHFSHRSNKSLLFLVFCLGGMLHLILDSVAGEVWWFAPYSDKAFALVTVTARFKPWWLNFILHWSFALELLICLWGFLTYRKRCHRSHDISQ